MVRRSAVLLALVGLASVPWGGVVGVPDPEACTNTNPANDCFKDAIVITTRSFHGTAVNTHATVEEGEPLGPEMANTVWWKFVATTDMAGSFSVSGSDHQAGHVVYELQADGTLKFLDYKAGQTGNPWTSFSCVAGRTYYVQAGGEEQNTGTIDLAGTACRPVPPPAPVLDARPGAARGEAALSWTSAGDGGGTLTSWVVQRSPAGCGAFAALATTPGDTLAHVDAGLAEGVARCYRVAGVNSAGTGAWSAARSATALGVPTVPRSVTATAGDGAITLEHLLPEHDGGSAVTGFRVYGADAAQGPFALLHETAATTSAETGLADGVTRHYRVHALNAFGEGPHAAASARTWTVPSAPRNADARWDVPLGVRLTWQAPADDGGLAIEEYVVLRGPKGGTLAPLATVDGATLVYRDRPPVVGAWDYAVVAVNAKGESPRSNRDCGQAVPLPPLPLVPHC